jgi:hypothetical protein
MRVLRPVPLAMTRVEVVEGPIGPPAGVIERIGIVDNDLDPPLMRGVVKGLERAWPGATVRVWTKPSGMSPAPDSLIVEMAKEVQVALAGVGM